MGHVMSGGFNRSAPSHTIVNKTVVNKTVVNRAAPVVRPVARPSSFSWSVPRSSYSAPSSYRSSYSSPRISFGGYRSSSFRPTRFGK